MHKLFISLVLLGSFTNYAGADETRAQIKCYANLSMYLFTVDLRNEKKNWEKKRQRHLELAVMAGRKEFANWNHDYGVDFYLGGFVERVFERQLEKLWCDDPDFHFDFCPLDKRTGKTTEEYSKIGLKFYERENCNLLLNK